LNVALIVSVWAVGSSTIVARPVPGEALAGFSFAPERFAKKVIGAAWAAGAGRVSTDANANKQEPIALRGRDSFMFASLAEELKPDPVLQAMEASLNSLRFKGQ